MVLRGGPRGRVGRRRAYLKEAAPRKGRAASFLFSTGSRRSLPRHLGQALAVANGRGFGPAAGGGDADRDANWRVLLSAAQDAGQIASDLDLDQILDLVFTVAKIPGTPEYRQPILDAALAGLRTPGDLPRLHL
jgi:hypothetical protein